MSPIPRRSRIERCSLKTTQLPCSPSRIAAVLIAGLVCGCNEFFSGPLDASAVDARAQDLAPPEDQTTPRDVPLPTDPDVLDVPPPRDTGVEDAMDAADATDVVDAVDSADVFLDRGSVASDVDDAGDGGFEDRGDSGLDVLEGGMALLDVPEDRRSPQDAPDVFDAGCRPTEVICGGACVNLQTDRNHCNGCGVVCPTGQGCSAGRCQIVCGAGITNCSGVCRDTSTDESNCGGCGVACGSLQRCVAGVCQDLCPGGTVYMPAVTFAMGTAQVQTGPERDQNPQHQVTLRPYCLGRFEVTLEDYRRCIAAGRCTAVADPDSRCNWNNSGRERDPVNCIDFSQAVSVCSFLYDGGRLPTEAEWENAASVSGTRLYPWGDTAPSTQLCWSGAPNPQRTSTCAVGTFRDGNTPNGISDLSGNVYEWLSDWYGAYSATSQTDPTGPTTGTERVHRGGTAFGTPATAFTSRVRNRDAPTGTAYYLGVRCATDPGASAPAMRVRVAVSSQVRFAQAGATDLVSQVCGAGEVLLSGGCSASSPDNVLLTTGAPLDGGNAWQCYGRSNGQSATLQSHALCTDTPGTVVRRVVGMPVTSATGTEGSVGPAEALCQAGETLAGGGCRTGSSSVVLSSSFPIQGQNGWRCAGRYSGSGDSSLTAFALCVNRVLPTRIVQESTGIVSTGGQIGTVTARCANGERIVGGGCRASDTLLRLSANHPSDAFSWSCRGSWGVVGGMPVLTAYAVCVGSTGTGG